MKKNIPLFLLALAVLAPSAPAQDRPKSREEAEALAATLKYQTGEIALRDGLAMLRVPEGLRFLKGADASTVLVRLWGNPPQDEPLGMLMPDVSPLSGDSWAVIISYEEDGFVKDEDAGKIDYAKLLKEMQKDTPVDRDSWREEVHHYRSGGFGGPGAQIFREQVRRGPYHGIGEGLTGLRGCNV